MVDEITPDRLAAQVVSDVPPDAFVPPDQDPNAIRLGSDGDPLKAPTATAMIEKESYERVIEGLKMSAEACMHLAKQEPQQSLMWKDIGQRLDNMRLQSCRLAGLDLTMKQRESGDVRGEAYRWRFARDRLLQGIRQASGGMRQLATCFRGDITWSIMAQTLERSEKKLRDLLVGRTPANPSSPLILPPGFVRQ